MESWDYPYESNVQGSRNDTALMYEPPAACETGACTAEVAKIMREHGRTVTVVPANQQDMHPPRPSTQPWASRRPR